MKRLLFSITAVIILGFTYYYFFMDTLSFSEITGKSHSSIANIMINIFDFDTGLTRHDIIMMKSKSKYWNSRINQVLLISDSNIREQEELKLMEEMLCDPSMKKVVLFFRNKGMNVFGSIVKLLI